MTSTIDADLCPDIDGQVDAHFESEATISSTGARAGSFVVSSRGTASATVGDDAFFHRMRVTGEAGSRSTGSTGELDVAVTADGSYTFSDPGNISSIQFDAGDPNAAHGNVTRQTADTTDAQIDHLYREVFESGAVVAALIFDAAQAKWRSGACVRIESTESSRTVEKNESFTFTNRVFHQVDGNELQKRIVASFNGVRSASPTDVEQDAPADVSFTAGSNDDDVGTVKLKSTSNRGIGELSLTFTVADGWSHHSSGGGATVDGEKCGGLGGQWVLEGTYRRSAAGGVQDGKERWVVTIDEDTLRGTYTYVDDAVLQTVVTVYVTGRASGDASLALIDDTVHMTLQDRAHTFSSTTNKGGRGNDAPVALQKQIIVWEPGAQCP
jgi:hypothetical protein